MQSIRRMERWAKDMYRPLVRAEQIWSCCITILCLFRQLELFWSDNVPKYMPSCPIAGGRGPRLAESTLILHHVPPLFSFFSILFPFSFPSVLSLRVLLFIAAAGCCCSRRYCPYQYLPILASVLLNTHTVARAYTHPSACTCTRTALPRPSARSQPSPKKNHPRLAGCCDRCHSQPLVASEFLGKCSIGRQP